MNGLLAALLVPVLLWLILFGAIATWLAEERGRDTVPRLFLGALLGPLVPLWRWLDPSLRNG